MFVTKDLIVDYKKWWLNQGYSLGTTIMYSSVLKNFIGDGININQKTVDTFRETHHSTVSSASLKSFFKFLVRKKQASPEILTIQFDKNKSVKKFPESINVDEVAAIINKMPNLRLQYFTIFLYELGLRISEGLKVKWEDINFSEWLKDRTQYGQVNIKKTKRGKFRSLPVKPELMSMLYNIPSIPKSSTGQPIGNVIFDIREKAGMDNIEDFINRKDNSPEQNLYDYIQLSKDYYRDVLYKISEEVIGRKINPHMLRHTKSLFLLNNGMSIDVLKEFLGHEKISTTEIYAQASSEKVKKELMKCDTYNKKI